ncbi:olfactory receptor 5V1-like [Pyxicephalus adspersus]|uniref:G-protein coupled receptors family 1 profile domain-containing protein n=1 Tax=Pyxicephalus adspersus TaxID=30357 RepID=A0AAV3ACL0_PYXAD|nr:TPA: hypothetical protein GDO54_013754 [Pyxicephalus adspersus]
MNFVLFSIFLIIYILTLISNVLIMMIVKMNTGLHTPMYVFIASLSLLENCYVTVTTPNMLSIFLVKCKTISFGGCMTQLYVFFSLGISECILLTVMAGDRYLAICNPLRYSSLITRRTCLHLVILSFLGGFLASVLTVTFVAILPYCGSNSINYFFCDYPALVTLACTESSTRKRMFFTLPWYVVLTCCLLIMASYICIIFTIKASKSYQTKAFSTCLSHLTVVLIFYGSVIFIYVRPKANYDLNKDKVISVVYSVVTPLLNPMIYSLRNKEFQKAVVNFVLGK